MQNDIILKQDFPTQTDIFPWNLELFQTSKK